MKAPGVIRIIAHRDAYPECAPGVVVCEREDGKGKKEVVASLIKDEYIIEIPLTEDNLEIAKRFWCRRFCRVEVQHTPLEIPFKQEEYDEWLEGDKKFLDKKAKELKTVEAEIKKVQASIPGLIRDMDAQASLQLAAEFQAQEAKRPKPEPSAAYSKAFAAINAAKFKETELQAKIDEIKAEMA